MDDLAVVLDCSLFLVVGGGVSEESTTPQKSTTLVSFALLTALCGKRYKLYCVPLETEVCDQPCFTTIGKGETFCVAQGRSIMHQGSRWEPDPGALFIAKTPTTAYCIPSVPISCLHADFVMSTMATSQLLEGWMRFFVAANGIPPEVPITQDLLEAEYEKIMDAHLHPTPCKNKSLDNISMAGRDNNYQKQVKDSNIPETEGKLKAVVEVVCSIDAAVEQNSQSLNWTLQLLFEEQKNNSDAHKTAP